MTVFTGAGERERSMEPLYEAGTNATELVTNQLQRSKYCNPWVCTLEVDITAATSLQTLGELRADLMGKIISTAPGVNFEVTDVNELTALVKSKTPGFSFLMSHDVPFERIPHDGGPLLQEMLARHPGPARGLYIIKVEKVPWVFDPETPPCSTAIPS